ncbi:hypothetical protein [Kitasatospora sp. GAS1066B]|uniref:LppU/SCO3897 family protein n=1 Tax=Kitasatospora sp. GAS1066B TaxID=3156271 RepID=UPI00351859BE
MPDEIVLALSASEAAAGTTVTLRLPDSAESMTIRIPPVEHGTVLRIPGATGDLIVRIQVTSDGVPGAPLGPAFAPKPRPRSGANGKLIAGLLAVGIAIVVGVMNSGHHGSSTGDSAYTPPTFGPVPSFTYSLPTLPALPMPTLPIPTFNYDPSQLVHPITTPNDAPSDTPSSAPTFAVHDCLSGTLPDSTTAQSVDGVDVISCSSANAHYKVIQSFFGTTDLSKCQDNPDSQYSFSEETTYGGATISSEVYCVVGLGSYAR